MAPERRPSLDMLRGVAVLWMTAFHFSFDLNHFGFIHQDFYRDPVWTVQRTCILSLFLFCAGFGQAIAVRAGQTWGRFFRRWMQVFLCALAVSAGSAFMFPNSWIYFGVLHGIALMLLICRASATWGRVVVGHRRLRGAAGHWRTGFACCLAPAFCTRLTLAELAGPDQPQAHHRRLCSALALVGRDVVGHGYRAIGPVKASGHTGLPSADNTGPTAALAWVGRWSLSWYMLHQPLLIGLLALASRLMAQPAG
jgi:uncharacterized membrane protein